MTAILKTDTLIVDGVDLTKMAKKVKVRIAVGELPTAQVEFYANVVIEETEPNRRIIRVNRIV